MVRSSTSFQHLGQKKCAATIQSTSHCTHGRALDITTRPHNVTSLKNAIEGRGKADRQIDLPIEEGEEKYVARLAGTAISAVPLHQYQQLLQESLATAGN